MKNNFLIFGLIMTLLGMLSYGGFVLADSDGMGDVDTEINDVQENAQNVLGLAKKMIGDNKGDKPATESSDNQESFTQRQEMMKAMQMGLRQQLELLRKKSQFEVENLFKLAFVPDPSDKKNIFVQLPWVISYIATVARDENALPKIFEIWFNGKTKLFYFFVFVVFTFFLAKFMTKFYNRNVSSIRAVGRCIVRIFTIYSLRLIFFVFLFYDQMGPLGKVTKDFIMLRFRN